MLRQLSKSLLHAIIVFPFTAGKAKKQSNAGLSTHDGSISGTILLTSVLVITFVVMFGQSSFENQINGGFFPLSRDPKHIYLCVVFVLATIVCIFILILVRLKYQIVKERKPEDKTFRRIKLSFLWIFTGVSIFNSIIMTIKAITCDRKYLQELATFACKNVTRQEISEFQEYKTIVVYKCTQIVFYIVQSVFIHSCIHSRFRVSWQIYYGILLIFLANISQWTHFFVNIYASDDTSIENMVYTFCESKDETNKTAICLPEVVYESVAPYCDPIELEYSLLSMIFMAELWPSASEDDCDARTSDVFTFSEGGLIGSSDIPLLSLSNDESAETDSIWAISRSSDFHTSERSDGESSRIRLIEDNVLISTTTATGTSHEFINSERENSSSQGHSLSQPTEEDFVSRKESVVTLTTNSIICIITGILFSAPVFVLGFLSKSEDNVPKMNHTNIMVYNVSATAIYNFSYDIVIASALIILLLGCFVLLSKPSYFAPKYNEGVSHIHHNIIIISFLGSLACVVLELVSCILLLRLFKKENIPTAKFDATVILVPKWVVKILQLYLQVVCILQFSNYKKSAVFFDKESACRRKVVDSVLLLIATLNFCLWVEDSIFAATSYDNNTLRVVYDKGTEKVIHHFLFPFLVFFRFESFISFVGYFYDNKTAELSEQPNYVNEESIEFSI